jgi:hypothetical protein
VEAPKANPEKLLTILQDACDGKVVLPEFQRNFLWPRDSIEELLVSILQGYFVGTLLLLDTQSTNPLFPFRNIEGLELVNPNAKPLSHSTIRLALDGQQRITSLFYALYEPNIPLKNTTQAHKFFFRLDLALDGDPEDAVIGLPVGSKRRISEMSQYVDQHIAIPFSLLRNAQRLYKWLYAEQTFLTQQKDIETIECFCRNFTDYMIPVVSLPSATRKMDIVNIFERINRTGISLSTFDLAVARLYRKDVKLRDLLAHFENAHSQAAKNIKPEFLLKFISLMEGIVPRKSNLVDVADKLTPQRFEVCWNSATQYISKAFNRLTSTSGGYGAFDSRWIPYTTIIVPLAYLLMEIEKIKGGENEYRKLDAWYWASVFSERYDSAVDTKSSDDIKDVLKWIQGGQPPSWVKAFSAPNIDLTVDDQRSAIYRGVMCLVALRGAKDFCNGQKAALHECDDDHIFPHSRYKDHESVNSIANRTLISPESNKIKRAKRPPEYLPIFLKKHGDDEMRLHKTLKSHFISDDAHAAMQNGKEGMFEDFIQARQKEIAKEIQQRTS